MGASNPDLRQIALRIVAMHQPCSAYTLVGILQRDYGVGTAAANATLFKLIRDGDVKRTFDGQLMLPGGRHKPSIARMIALTVFLLLVAAFIGWVFYNLFVLNGGRLG